MNLALRRLASLKNNRAEIWAPGRAPGPSEQEEQRKALSRKGKMKKEAGFLWLLCDCHDVHVSYLRLPAIMLRKKVSTQAVCV